jgi:hypothetical protein
MNQVFQKISDDISNKLDCSRFGNCIHFAELFTEKVGMTDTDSLDDFFVIEGYVKIGSEVLEHTWIETKEGVKIDPTNQQFGDFKYSSKIVNKWTGLEYYMVMRKDLTWRKEREEYPKKVFKHIKEYNKFFVTYGSEYVEEFNKKFEGALPRKKTIDQLKRIRKLSKSTDIGDRVPDLKKQGANIHYYQNPIDTGIESYEDFEKKNKSFIPGWNLKHLTSPFKGEK